MDIFIRTDFPKTCSKEVRELIDKTSCEYEKICVVENISKEEIVKLCYHLQSAIKISLLLNKAKFEDIKINIPKEYLVDINTFAVRSEHSKDVTFNSTEINTKIGKQIDVLDVDLDDPNIVFYAYVDKECFFGIDLTGFDMSIRQYKIYMQPDSLNGCFAYNLLREFEVKGKVLDMFSGSGSLAIEFALYTSKISPFIFENKFIGNKLTWIKDQFFEQEMIEKETLEDFKSKSTSKEIIAYDDMLKKVLGLKRNAKLAGVDKVIDMSKISIDWLDTKIEEKSLDFIITNPPKLNSKRNNNKDINKLYDELFYQAKFILKPNGKILIITNHSEIIKENAKKHKLKIEKESEILRGMSKYKLILIGE